MPFYVIYSVVQLISKFSFDFFRLFFQFVFVPFVWFQFIFSIFFFLGRIFRTHFFPTYFFQHIFSNFTCFPLFYFPTAFYLIPPSFKLTPSPVLVFFLFGIYSPVIILILFHAFILFRLHHSTQPAIYSVHYNTYSLLTETLKRSRAPTLTTRLVFQKTISVTLTRIYLIFIRLAGFNMLFKFLENCWFLIFLCSFFALVLRYHFLLYFILFFTFYCWLVICCDIVLNL